MHVVIIIFNKKEINIAFFPLYVVVCGDDFHYTFHIFRVYMFLISQKIIFSILSFFLSFHAISCPCFFFSYKLNLSYLIYIYLFVSKSIYLYTLTCRLRQLLPLFNSFHASSCDLEPLYIVVQHALFYNLIFNAE